MSVQQLEVRGVGGQLQSAQSYRVGRVFGKDNPSCLKV